MPREAETLVGHLSAVTRIASLLVGSWGDRYLAALGLDAERFAGRLRLALPRAAFAHDLAKANDHFQAVVRSDPAVVDQAAWHEHLIAWLLLASDSLGSWLFDGCDDELRRAILVAALGHHLRVTDAKDVSLRSGSGALRLVLLAGHPDFASALRVGSDLLGLGEPPAFSDLTLDLLDSGPFDDAIRPWLRDAALWWQRLGDEERRLVAAMKALVIAADVSGSALPRNRVEPAQWVATALANTVTEDIMSAVVVRKLPSVAPRPFQTDVAASPTRITFVRAGCGSGKTVAAYLWACERSQGRKLFFCYPTTGTASQGFVDYVPPDEFEAALVHSRAAVDLEELLSDGTDAAEARLDWLIRFSSLIAWDAPIIVSTVDTVLGLIQNNRTGLFSFPAIAEGAFVFDEIHQYDDRLFGSLLRFLETFRGVSVLLMTASLPRARLTALEACVGRLGERMTIVEGPGDLEALKRYQLVRAEEATAWERVAAAIEAGERVLWVANTVSRAIQLAVDAEAKGLPVLPYHGRYRYVDRLARHSDVVGAFAGQARKGIVAVTTQVCEISLDISADLLVTDLAPIPALIQRLGRLNRRITADRAVRPKRALVLDPPRPDPYSRRELDDSVRWLGALGSEPRSQADLADAFRSALADVAEAPSTVRSAWLDGGVLAAAAPLREEGVTIPVIREEDAARLRSRPPEAVGREAIRLTIPMPIGPVSREIRSWRGVAGVLVAPSGRLIYDERFGGRWR